MAHLKLIGMDDAGAFAVGNVVSSDTAPKLSLPCGLHAAGSGPDRERARRDRPGGAGSGGEAGGRGASARRSGVTAEFRTSQSLRPGRPVPTHRYAAAKE